MKVYKTHWKKELSMAKRILKDEDIGIEEVWENYICFKIIGLEVRIVAYPHTVKSTGNKHIRVRDEGSINKAEASRIMKKLDEESGFNCSFSRKGH